ncbi:MAG: hypothetical protein AABX86_01705 [Nanoarchaeota archaeon]
MNQTDKKEMTPEEIKRVSEKPNKFGDIRIDDIVLESTTTEKGEYQLLKRIFYDANTGKIAKATLYLLHKNDENLPKDKRYVRIGRAKEYFDKNDKLTCGDEEKLTRLRMNLLTQEKAKAVYDLLRIYHQY